MRISIIGGTGLVGPYLLQEIFANIDNAQISTLTRSGQPYFTETAFQGDRQNPAHLKHVLDKAAPDILIDMVPFTCGNAEITANIINNQNQSLPVIAISSIDVYAAYAKIHKTENVDYQNCPLTEDMTLREELGPEGESYNKLDVEKIYLDSLENVTLMRLPATYGWPDTRRIANYLDPMLAGQDQIEIPKQRAHWKFSRCLHKNAAYAIFMALQAAQTGQHIYNVAEAEALTEQEWCQKIAAFCGWQGQIKFSNDTEDVDLKQDFYVSTQKIRDEIGFTEKYDPDEGLADTIKAYAYQKLPQPYKQSY